MDYLKLLENSHKQQHEFDPHETSKLEYLSCYIFDFTTYDSGIDELFATKALEVCIAVSDRKTFDYQKDAENYRWYLVMCNMPFFENKLEWGTSIRGAWWNLHLDDEFELSSCGLYSGYEQILTPLKFKAEQWASFISAMSVFAGVELKI